MEAKRLKVLSVAIALSGVAAAVQAQDQQKILPTIHVTTSRLDNGIVGASTTVITAEEIARSPGESLQEIINRVPGVQSWSLFGAVNGAGTTVDIRGFGAAAASNTLVLINGRRLTDIDLAGVDFSAVPRESIERIEITRGSAGAVLYGEGAVGGVINIVTKTGSGLAPAARIDGALGSYGQREANAAARGSLGPFAAAVFSNYIDSDGYRVNNALRQRNVLGDFRYVGEHGSFYANLSLDDQHLGLPGARRVTLTTSELVTDRRGATTPTAFAEKQGYNATFGATRRFGNWLELIVDGGVRSKEQRAFSELFGFAASDARELTTLSFTPRFVARNNFLGIAARTIAGLDFYDADLVVNRSTLLSDPPIHRYALRQRSFAAYGQTTLGLSPATDLSLGARVQRTQLAARDRFDPTAPGAFFFDAEANPLNTKEVNHALHLGVEHRFAPSFAVFGRVARSFRTPNVDERVGVAAFPVDFRLRTQTSRDVEGGVRLNLGALEIQSSVYHMWLENELHFVPFPPLGANTNLDPTRRYGSETSALLQVNERLRLKGGFAYTRAVFREGPFTGNDVPLVSRWTANAGASWNIWHKHLVLDVVAKYVGARRMDNDQANFQPLIPAHTLVDVRIGGEAKNVFWSFAVHNLFNVDYFDYAVASASTFGTYNAYPQPGRTYMARLGVKFE
ncbi:MAG TPA: TonB-dependent receptor [Xanthobacteraceae bacterium]|nr:TonB-dependent receptor [Xanthobacteraceae bacterium]